MSGLVRNLLESENKCHINQCVIPMLLLNIIFDHDMKRRKVVCRQHYQLYLIACTRLTNSLM